MIEYEKRYLNLEYKSSYSLKDKYQSYASYLYNFWKNNSWKNFFIWENTLTIIQILIFLYLLIQGFLYQDYELIFILLSLPITVIGLPLLLMLIIHPLFFVFYRLPLKFKREGIWLTFHQGFFTANYLYKEKNINYKDLSITIDSDPIILVFSKKHDYWSSNSIFSNDSWITFANKEKIPLSIEYNRYLHEELKTNKTKFVALVKGINDSDKKISLMKWQEYLKMDSSIIFIKKTQFENYSEVQLKEEESTYYYEWRENGNLIAFIDYVDNRGMVFIDILEEKFHLVEKMAKDLEAEIDD